jgi:hypothetical protein
MGAAEAFALPRAGGPLGALVAQHLERPRHTSHGEFIYNLHLVAVHQRRFAEAHDDFCRRTLEMLRGVAGKKNHLLSRVGLLLDHVHWTVGCGIEESPLQVGLSYLNNLAYAEGMRPLFQFGFYVGTFAPYDMNAVRHVLADQSSSRRGEPGGECDGKCSGSEGCESPPSPSSRACNRR